METRCCCSWLSVSGAAHGDALLGADVPLAHPTMLATDPGATTKTWTCLAEKARCRPCWPRHDPLGRSPMNHPPLLPLAGVRALVTAGGQGIGLGIAEHLLR